MKGVETNISPDTYEHLLKGMQMNQQVNSTRNTDEPSDDQPENRETNILDNAESTRGWCVFKRKYLERFRTPQWALFFLCWAGALQGFVVNGFVNVVITTIEKRYRMRSTESGLIAGGYDVASFILLVPVSYYGGTRSKPLYIGIGVFVLAFGALVFSSPYFTAGPYEFSIESEPICGRSSDDTCKNVSNNAGLSHYKFVFFLGQFLHGAGATPLFTLGCTYIDESVPTHLSSLYVGIYYTMSLLGPGIGYILGGQFLQYYVDWGVDPKEVGLTPSSNVWVGMWWFGFLVGASVGILIAIPILTFPKELPGTKEIRSKKVSEMHKNLQNSEALRNDFGKTFKDLPKSLRYLITNPTFMFLNLAGASEGMLISALATFLPKVIEQQFSMAASSAALVFGLVTLPGAGGGTFLGGYIVKRFQLRCASIMKFCICCSMVSLCLVLSFLISCPNAQFVGITSPYPNDPLGKLDLSSECNSNCSCSIYRYDPICGLNNQMFYSPCHAGCKTSMSYGDTKAYSDCECLRGQNRSRIVPEYHDIGMPIEAIREKCPSECGLLPLFLTLVFLCMLFTFLVSMPSLTATLRCVADSQRSFALGVQWIAVRILGTIPAPLIFGSLIDLSCVLWQTSCDSNSGACLIYDNSKMSRNLLLMSVSLKVLSVMFFFFSWFFYKPSECTVLHEETVPNEIHEKNSQISNLGISECDHLERDLKINENVTKL